MLAVAGGVLGLLRDDAGARAAPGACILEPAPPRRDRHGRAGAGLHRAHLPGDHADVRAGAGAAGRRNEPHRTCRRADARAPARRASGCGACSSWARWRCRWCCWWARDCWCGASSRCSRCGPGSTRRTCSPSSSRCRRAATRSGERAPDLRPRARAPAGRAAGRPAGRHHLQAAAHRQRPALALRVRRGHGAELGERHGGRPAGVARTTSPR